MMTLTQRPTAILITLVWLLASHTVQAKSEIAVIFNTIQGSQLDLSADVPTNVTLTPKTEMVDLHPDKQSQSLYYTVGGLRLKLSAEQLPLTQREANANPTYTWTFNQAGRLCDNLNYQANNSNCDNITPDQILDQSHERINDPKILYWEPLAWDNQTDTQANLTIAFPDDPKLIERTIPFRIKNRVLSPAVGPSQSPTSGSDVKLLESMLWHLGISPVHILV